MRNLSHVLVTALIALWALTLISCQSHLFQRTPSSETKTLKKNVVKNLKELTKELLLTLPAGDHPRRMLFDFYLATLNDLRPNEDASWVLQKRTMDLVVGLNQSLLEDPFTEKNISLVYDTFTKMDEVFKEHPSYLVPQKMIDEQDELARRRFLFFQSGLIAADVKSKEVMIAAKDKKKLLTLMNRVQAKFSLHSEASYKRFLASQKSEITLTAAEKALLEKLSVTSIQVQEQGDIFGGYEALGKSQRLQYGARFLLAILKKSEPVKWKKVGMR